MRVLQATPYFAPAWAYGGPPRVMHTYAKGLAARGHAVSVFTTDVLDEGRRSSPPFEVVDGVSVRRFRNVSNALAWRTKKYLPPMLPAALVHAAGAADVLHVTDTRTIVAASAHAAARVRHVPLVISAFGSLPRSTGFRGAVKDVYDVALVRPMLRRAALLFAQTSHEADLYAELGGAPEAIRLLPLPLPPIVEPSRRGSFRARLGIAAKEPLLLFLGRLSPLKGVDELILSVAPLLSEGAVLALVGRDDGQLVPLRARFAALFDDRRIRFAGPLYGDDRFAAYADADVFCLTPIHWEETSLASLEAAACGTAVVVTEQAELPGLTPATGGFVVPLDREAIRAAVSTALADPALGERARRHVHDHHAPETIVAALEAHLTAL